MQNSPKKQLESPQIGRPDQRSNRERGLNLNIITGVLRSVPEGEDNSRLHYFQGLDDIAALFLINLGSPSLASLVMKPLCNLHFRDAMRPNFLVVQNILQAVIMPLLEVVDRRLHDYIIKGGTDDSSVFALSWVNTWFAHEIRDFDILSRLYDVFLVSHPLFPAYLAVGLLTYPPNRKIIMNTYCEFSALYRVICELPKKMGANQNESQVVNAFEDCIQLSLCYIRDYPPSKLINLSHKYRCGYMKESLTPAPAVFLLGPPPRWAISSTAPTDWSLIKLAKKMRDQSSESRLARRRCLRLKHFIEEINPTTDEHKIALIAFGLGSYSPASSRFRISKTARLIGVALLVGSLYGNEYYRGPTAFSKLLPSASLIKGVGHTLKKSGHRRPVSKRKPNAKPKAKSNPNSILMNEEVSSKAPPHSEDSDPKDTQSFPSSDDSSDDQKQTIVDVSDDENTPQSTVSQSTQKEPDPVITEAQNILNTDPIEVKTDVDEVIQSDTVTSSEEISEVQENIEEPTVEGNLTRVHEDDKENAAIPAVPLSNSVIDEIPKSKQGISSSLESTDNEMSIGDISSQANEGKEDKKGGNIVVLALFQEELDNTHKEIQELKDADDIVDDISSFLDEVIRLNLAKDKAVINFDILSNDEDEKLSTIEVDPDDLDEESEEKGIESTSSPPDHEDGNQDNNYMKYTIPHLVKKGKYSSRIPGELPKMQYHNDLREGENDDLGVDFTVEEVDPLCEVLHLLLIGLRNWISNDKLYDFDKDRHKRRRN